MMMVCKFNESLGFGDLFRWTIRKKKKTFGMVSGQIIILTALISLNSPESPISLAKKKVTTNFGGPNNHKFLLFFGWWHVPPDEGVSWGPPHRDSKQLQKPGTKVHPSDEWSAWALLSWDQTPCFLFFCFFLGGAVKDLEGKLIHEFKLVNIEGLLEKTIWIRWYQMSWT